MFIPNCVNKSPSKIINTLTVKRLVVIFTSLFTESICEIVTLILLILFVYPDDFAGPVRSTQFTI